MKTLFIAFVGIIGLCALAKAQSASADTAADAAAIRRVIVEQTDAFFAKNKEKWAGYWVHEPYVSWTAQGGADRVLTVSGWEAYSSMFEGYFSGPAPGGPAPKIVHENFQVTVLDKVATATFLQTRQSDARNLKSREARVLEKQGANWKLVSVYSRNIE